MKYKISWPIALSITIILFISIFSYLNIKSHGLLQSTKKIELKEIVKTPINYNAERKILTAIYRKEHTGDCDFEKQGLDKCIKIIPRLIIMHMTANESLEKSLLLYYSPFLKKNKNILKNDGGNLNLSVHFLIDKDGTIYNLMPETYMSRSALGINHLSIAISNVGFSPTNKQVKSSVRLIKYLLKKYKTIKGLLAHTELKELQESETSFFIEKKQKNFETKYCGLEITRLIREKLSFKGIFIR